jgi:hypothetical protein
MTDPLISQQCIGVTATTPLSPGATCQKSFATSCRNTRVTRSITDQRDFPLGQSRPYGVAASLHSEVIAMKQQKMFGPVSWVIEPTVLLASAVLSIVLFFAEINAIDTTVIQSNVPDTASVRSVESAESISARAFNHRV